MLEWGLSHHLSVGMAIDRPEICTYRKTIDTWMIKIPLFLNINVMSKISMQLHVT